MKKTASSLAFSVSVHLFFSLSVLLFIHLRFTVSVYPLRFYPIVSSYTTVEFMASSIYVIEKFGRSAENDRREERGIISMRYHSKALIGNPPTRG